MCVWLFIFTFHGIFDIRYDNDVMRQKNVLQLYFKLMFVVLKLVSYNLKLQERERERERERDELDNIQYTAKPQITYTTTLTSLIIIIAMIHTYLVLSLKLRWLCVKYISNSNLNITLTALTLKAQGTCTCMRSEHIFFRSSFLRKLVTRRSLKSLNTHQRTSYIRQIHTYFNSTRHERDKKYPLYIYVRGSCRQCNENI